MGIVIVSILAVGLGVIDRAWKHQYWRERVHLWRGDLLERPATPKEGKHKKKRRNAACVHQRVSVTMKSADLAILVSDVATRLRAGAPQARAWQRAWEHGGFGECGPISDEGIPLVVETLSKPVSLRSFRPCPNAECTLWACLWGHLRKGIRQRTPSGKARLSAARTLVAACRFTACLGAPLAEVLDMIADGIDEAEAAEDARQIARSGPQTSARVLTLLPMIGVGGAELLGAAPIERFFDGGVGTVSFGIGIACFLIGHSISRIMLRAAFRADASIDPAILCDLARAGLESGASIPATLKALGHASGEKALERVSQEILYGVEWKIAWRPLPKGSELIARALEGAWCEGASPLPVLARSAQQLRTRRMSDARTQAEKLGVRLVLPLGVFLLPAFVALAVIPVIVHIAEGGFGW